MNLEALKISLEVDGATSQEQIANAISVEAHVSNVGWQAAVGNGGTAGTTGQSRAVEALRVRLSGELSARYTVWYRVHSAEFGWLGWACVDWQHLFGRFREGQPRFPELDRRHVAQRRVDPEVVVPVHVVRELGP